MIFGIILVLTIIALFLNLIWRFKSNDVNAAKAFAIVKSDISSGIKSYKGKSSKDKNIFNILRSFLYSLSLILFCLMAASGFFLPLLWQQTDGIFLFIHLVLAPFFVLSVTFAIALFANKMQFNGSDYKYLEHSNKSISQKSIFWKKINFWLFVIIIILNISSVALAMFPVFGTSGQHWLITVHRYSALLLFVLFTNYVTLRYTLKK